MGVGLGHRSGRGFWREVGMSGLRPGKKGIQVTPLVKTCVVWFYRYRLAIYFSGRVLASLVCVVAVLINGVIVWTRVGVDSSGH